MKRKSKINQKKLNEKVQQISTLWNSQKKNTPIKSTERRKQDFLARHTPVKEQTPTKAITVVASPAVSNLLTNDCRMEEKNNDEVRELHSKLDIKNLVIVEDKLPSSNNFPVQFLSSILSSPEQETSSLKNSDENNDTRSMEIEPYSNDLNLIFNETQNNSQKTRKSYQSTNKNNVIEHFRSITSNRLKQEREKRLIAKKLQKMNDNKKSPKDLKKEVDKMISREPFTRLLQNSIRQIKKNGTKDKTLSSPSPVSSSSSFISRSFSSPSPSSFSSSPPFLSIYPPLSPTPKTPPRSPSSHSLISINNKSSAKKNRILKSPYKTDYQLKQEKKQEQLAFFHKRMGYRRLSKENNFENI